MHLSAVAIGLLLVVGAGVAGFLAFYFAGGAAFGLMWGVCVFLGLLLAAVVVAVLRANYQGQSEQP